MKTVGALNRALQSAEREVLTALAQAAQAGDLESVDKARRVAGELRRISQNLNRDAASQNGSSDLPTKPERKKSNRRSVEPNATKTALKKYPEFITRRDTLYRRAWSRKKHMEYEHKAPRQTVEEVVRALADAAAGETKPVPVERIMSKVNRSSTVSIPQYQVYLVIGWLRHGNCIEQVGRDGYRIPLEIVEAANELWRAGETTSASKRQH